MKHRRRRPLSISTHTFIYIRAHTHVYTRNHSRIYARPLTYIHATNHVYTRNQSRIYTQPQYEAQPTHIVIPTKRSEGEDLKSAFALYKTSKLPCNFKICTSLLRRSRYDKRGRLYKRERLYNMGKVIKEVVNNGNHDHQGRHVRIALCDWKILYIQLYEYS